MTVAKEIIYAKHFQQCLAHRRQLLNASYWYSFPSDYSIDVLVRDSGKF